MFSIAGKTFKKMQTGKRSDNIRLNFYWKFSFPAKCSGLSCPQSWMIMMMMILISGSHSSGGGSAWRSCWWGSVSRMRMRAPCRGWECEPRVEDENTSPVSRLRVQAPCRGWECEPSVEDENASPADGAPAPEPLEAGVATLVLGLNLS